MNIDERVDLSSILYGFDEYLLNSPSCSQEDREIGMELFSKFIGSVFTEECLNCGAKLYLTNDSVSEDEYGKYVVCRECESSFNIKE